METSLRVKLLKYGFTTLVWGCAYFSYVIFLKNVIKIQCILSFQALDALLDLSASSYEQSKNCKDNVNNRQDTGFLTDCADSVSNMDFVT